MRHLTSVPHTHVDEADEQLCTLTENLDAVYRILSTLYGFNVTPPAITATGACHDCEQDAGLHQFGHRLVCRTCLDRRRRVAARQGIQAA